MLLFLSGLQMLFSILNSGAMKEQKWSDLEIQGAKIQYGDFLPCALI